MKRGDILDILKPVLPAHQWNDIAESFEQWHQRRVDAEALLRDASTFVPTARAANGEPLVPLVDAIEAHMDKHRVKWMHPNYHQAED